MVNANDSKELQNVLPKCNLFAPHIVYDFRRDEACLIRLIGTCRPRTLTFTNKHNTHKKSVLHLPPLLLVPPIVHFGASYERTVALMLQKRACRNNNINSIISVMALHCRRRQCRHKTICLCTLPLPILATKRTLPVRFSALS